MSTLPILLTIFNFLCSCYTCFVYSCIYTIYIINNRPSYFLSVDACSRLAGYSPVSLVDYVQAYCIASYIMLTRNFIYFLQADNVSQF